MDLLPEYLKSILKSALEKDEGIYETVFTNFGPKEKPGELSLIVTDKRVLISSKAYQKDPIYRGILRTDLKCLIFAPHSEGVALTLVPNSGPQDSVRLPFSTKERTKLNRICEDLWKTVEIEVLKLDVTTQSKLEVRMKAAPWGNTSATLPEKSPFREDESNPPTTPTGKSSVNDANSKEAPANRPPDKKPMAPEIQPTQVPVDSHFEAPPDETMINSSQPKIPLATIETASKPAVVSPSQTGFSIPSPTEAGFNKVEKKPSSTVVSPTETLIIQSELPKSQEPQEDTDEIPASILAAAKRPLPPAREWVVSPADKEEPRMAVSLPIVLEKPSDEEIIKSPQPVDLPPEGKKEENYTGVFRILFFIFLSIITGFFFFYLFRFPSDFDSPGRG